ncbi:MAG: PH domain-containing protein [Candidatus Heimdallarchaeota archaeon]|nr:PH domain-containing protein [Candidatus Heimdallarchaeota archaeon]
MTENTKEIFGLGKQKILEEFTPNKRFITILFIVVSIFFILGVGGLIGVLAGILSEAIGSPDYIDAFLLGTYIIIGIGVILYIVGIILIFPYYNSINYVFTTQEIIVNKGFIVKRTKIVPYRNITNFVMRRGILDRLIGGNNFGTILIETAGQGPQQANPEQRLVGIMDVSGYTEKIRGILSKMKGQAAITADTETASSLDEETLLLSILDILKEIKNKL